MDWTYTYVRLHRKYIRTHLNKCISYMKKRLFIQLESFCRGLRRSWLTTSDSLLWKSNNFDDNETCDYDHDEHDDADGGDDVDDHDDDGHGD